MLEGKNVNLRIVEREDLPLAHEWMNNPEFMGEFIAPIQRTKEEFEQTGSSLFAPKLFFIEKKDGSKIGLTNHFNSYLGMGELLEIGYFLAPNERGKGYCTEAAQLMWITCFFPRMLTEYRQQFPQETRLLKESWRKQASREKEQYENM